MARKSHDDALGVTGAETVIGTGVVVAGDLSSDSDIAVDGTLNGGIKAGGNVTIGVNASVSGDVRATNVIIAGQLKGNVTAEGEVSIRETGHIKGDIKSASLSVNAGAIFVGRSLMQEQPQLAHSDKDQEA
jgi:cytoskeletal protein CcmA (bactofilin family)